ncbi:MAG: hypothetical protein JKY95_15525 [Planctomycetaceae bacterium]|nr:hypothetical protein [Planctomycetaceae bacterium]
MIDTPTSKTLTLLRLLVPIRFMNKHALLIRQHENKPTWKPDKITPMHWLRLVPITAPL